MYHEILPPCTHAQKEITCSNASLHPREQFYMHKNTSASLLIVWELKEQYCQLLKKGSLLGSAHVPRKVGEFQSWYICALPEHLSELLKKAADKDSVKCAALPRWILPPCTHVRRRRSPVPMQVYIPVNSSICIRTCVQSVFIVWELKELTEHLSAA